MSRFNWKAVVGVVTIGAITGSAVYYVYNKKKKEKQEAEVISLDEAREIMKQKKRSAYAEEVPVDEDELETETTYKIQTDIDEYEREEEAEVRKIKEGIDNVYGPSAPQTKEEIEAQIRANELLIADLEEDDDDPYEEDYAEISEEEESAAEEIGFTYDECNFEVPLAEIMKEEDKELRYEPNSNEARNQYIRMELAEWLPTEETYSIMLTLFNFPFEPVNDGDWDLKTKIIDYRVQFFGFESRWAKEVTMADVFLHFVRLAVFNQGEDMRYWLNYFLQFNEFEVLLPSQKVDELVHALNNHTYYNHGTNTYGMFGLSTQSMDKVFQTASRNIDNKVTYEIEFQEFLKTCL